MNWRARLGKLVGAASKTPAKKTAKKPLPAPAGSARAQIIAEARRIHSAQSANVRRQIAQSIDELQRAGAKTLHDPVALERLMGLIQASRAMGGLMRHDLKRNLVLTGMPQLLGNDEVSPHRSKSRVVKR